MLPIAFTILCSMILKLYLFPIQLTSSRLDKSKNNFFLLCYSETLHNEYIERIHQMSYSSLSDN